MIGRRAHKRQPQRHVDGAIEGQGLDRDQGLIVVHAKGGVEGFALSRRKQRIGRYRAEGLDSGIPKGLDGGADDLGFLRSHGAVFAGMGIEPGDGQPRPGDGEIRFQGRRRHQSGLGNEAGVEDFGGVAKAFVNGHRNDPEVVRGQHHHRRRVDAGKGGQELGMAGIGKARLIKGAFVDRVGDHGPGLAVHGQPDGGFYGRHDRLGVGGFGLAGHGVGRQRSFQHRQCGHENRRRLARSFDDFDGRRQPKVPGQRLQPRRIVDDEKRR